jgi:hypothetical protein
MYMIMYIRQFVKKKNICSPKLVTYANALAVLYSSISTASCPCTAGSWEGNDRLKNSQALNFVCIMALPHCGDFIGYGFFDKTID